MIVGGIAPMLVNGLILTSYDIDNIATEAPLVVMFGNSKAEIEAKNQFIENFPYSLIINYLDMEMILSYSGPIVYIGHSSVEGISNFGQIIGWDIIAEIITKSLSNDHFILGCDSETISSLTSSTGKNVISFDNKVDAIAGANIVSILIGITKGSTFNWLLSLFSKYNDRVTEIKNIPSNTLFLPTLDSGDGGYPPSTSTPTSTTTPSCQTNFFIKNPKKNCAGFTKSEALIHGLQLLLFVIMLLIPVAGLMIKKYVKISYEAIMALGHGIVAFNAMLAVISKSISAYNIYKNDGNAYAFAVTLIGIIPDFLVVVLEIKNMLPWIEAAKFWTGVSVDTAKAQPLVIAGMIALAVASFAAALYSAYLDWNDA